MKLNGNETKGKTTFCLSLSGMSFRFPLVDGRRELKANGIQSTKRKDNQTLPSLFHFFSSSERPQQEKKGEESGREGGTPKQPNKKVNFILIKGGATAPRRKENQRFSWLGSACAHTLFSHPSNAGAQPNAFDWN